LKTQQFIISIQVENISESSSNDVASHAIFQIATSCIAAFTGTMARNLRLPWLIYFVEYHEGIFRLCLLE